MSLETGTMGFRMFYLRQQLPVSEAEALANLQRAALPELDRMPGGRAEGWTGPRHLMDRDLSAGNVCSAGMLRLHYVRAVRKVPETLLQAECKAEEDAEMKARGCDCLSRVSRAEIRQRVREALTAKAQPSLDGIGVWVHWAKGVMIAEATNDSKLDALSAAFRAAFGSTPIICTPETAALVLKQVNSNDVQPVSLTPDAAKEPPAVISLGMEFLTWLFWRYDMTGGEFQTRLHGPRLGYMLEGPLTFWREGQGAHEVNIRKGTPLNSREAMTCLLDGKLLRKAKFVMASGDRIYTAMVDDGFLFGALKLPPCEMTDAEGRFQERALFTAEFTEAWLALYNLFLAERADRRAWSSAVEQIRAWISRRNGMEVAHA